MEWDGPADRCRGCGQFEKAINASVAGRQQPSSVAGYGYDHVWDPQRVAYIEENVIVVDRGGWLHNKEWCDYVNGGARKCV